MIIISGIIADEPIRLMCVRLMSLGFKYVFVDQMTYPGELKAVQEWGEDSTIKGQITCPDGTAVSYEDISGVYIRHSGFTSRDYLSDFDAHEQGVINAQRTMSLAYQFDYLPCVVANRLRNMLSNDCKPFQSLKAREAGFAVPRTLITSVPSQVLAFRDECQGKVIYKGVSSSRSVVQLLDSSAIDRLPLLKNCPVQVQEYIEGSNIRVHVVGERAFGLRIVSAGVDYRYCSRTFESISLPEDVERRSIALSKALGLNFSGIDLIEKDDVYYCLEVNPSPGYSFYELRARQPISVALAELLKDGRSYYRDHLSVSTDFNVA